MNHHPNADRLRDELRFSTARSGGPGGQNVNKVETKVTLKFDVQLSNKLTPGEREIIVQKLGQYITRDGMLMLTAQESRSQLENRQRVVEKFNALLMGAFKKGKIRRATKPSRTAKLKRLQSKKVLGEKKKWRQKP